MSSHCANGTRVSVWSKDAFLELRKRVAKKAEPTAGTLPDALSSDGILELFEELRIRQTELDMQNRELRLAHADIEASRARYFDLYDLAPVGYVTLNNDSAISEINLRATVLLGAARAALTGAKFSRSIAAEDQDAYYLSRRRLLNSGEPQCCELKMVPPNAAPFWARLEMSVGEDLAGARGCRIVIVDITDRRTAELKVQESERQLRLRANDMQVKEDELLRSLHEKETLLKEVRHRVKNNLQVISSLLRMQSNLLKDSDAAAALKESEQRVVSMALIHERLYGSRHMDRIDFAEYTHTLVGDLFYSYAGTADHVTGRFNITPVLLDVNQAVPCGLILNELVTNALKYAYPPGKCGEVVIDLSETPDGLVTLSVSDEGVGLPAEFDWQNSESMGLPIVDLLAKQIGGKLSVLSGRRTTFTVEFVKESAIASARQECKSVTLQ